jgi:hypothetical protein
MTGAAILCRHINLCADSLEVADTQQIRLRSSAEQYGYGCSVRCAAHGQLLGKSSDGRRTDSPGN